METIVEQIDKAVDDHKNELCAKNCAGVLALAFTEGDMTFRMQGSCTAIAMLLSRIIRHSEFLKETIKLAIKASEIEHDDFDEYISENIEEFFLKDKYKEK